MSLLNSLIERVKDISPKHGCETLRTFQQHFFEYFFLLDSPLVKPQMSKTSFAKDLSW